MIMRLNYVYPPYTLPCVINDAADAKMDDANWWYWLNRSVALNPDLIFYFTIETTDIWDEVKLVEDEMDFTTPNDRPDDPGLEDHMEGLMEPVVPCEWMPTRACVARWDKDEDGAHEVYATELCPKICWRYNRPVDARENADADLEAIIIVSQESIIGE